MTTRHAASSRLALPILVSCLALTACSGGEQWPESQVVTEVGWQTCIDLGYPEDADCLLGFHTGYLEARVSIDEGGDFTTTQLNEGYRRQASLVGSVAYTAGVDYARSVRP